MIYDDTFDPCASPKQDEPLTSSSMHMDFVDWRKGRQRYAVWAIDVDSESVRAAAMLLRHALGDCLLPEYRRQAHVTLRVCGFPAPKRGLDDDYTPADFARHVDALAQARIEPFSMTIGTPRTFPSAAYLSVEDDAGGIARIRDALAGEEPAEPDFAFVPHVTLGLYGRRVPVEQVMRRMAACPGLSAIQVEVRRIALMTYDAAVITGPLRSICAFDLAENRLRVLDAEAMRPLSGRS